MRIVSWNLHGADVPGRSTTSQQHQAWEYIRDLGADLVLAQEVSQAGVPDWARKRWTALTGEMGRCRKTWKWGSVIAAHPDLRLRLDDTALADPWLTQLYDLVLVGQIKVAAREVVVASVHTAAQSLRDWIRQFSVALSVSDAEVENLKRPSCSEQPYLNDLAFAGLIRIIGTRRFLAAGDWNTCRKYKGGPEFFTRAEANGWVECHQPPEVQSYFGRGSGEYQLDHAFADRATATHVICKVLVNEHVRQLSDHAPLVIDLESACG